SRPIFSKKSSSQAKVIVLLLVSLVLLFLDAHTNSMRSVRTALSVMILPVQRVIAWPIDGCWHFYQWIHSYHALLAENEDLKMEQLVLRAQVQRLEDQEMENNQLKALVHATSSLKFPMMIAELVSVNAGPLAREIMINKGSLDRVFVGQPVLDAN